MGRGNSQYAIFSPILGEDIQYMQDHALICKFMGLWPSEKSLMWWIKTRWNPKGEITLKLGSKGLFTAIFNLEEDRERVFQGGPYFFNYVDLYMWI
jgi:hypothetical protein